MVRHVLSLTSARISLGVLFLVALLAVFGPLLAPDDPIKNSSNTLAGISARHPLGTDNLGRDVLSRLLAGSRASVIGALEVAVIALVVGVVAGLTSVYLGRVYEWVTLRLADTLVALPFFLFAVAVTALLGNGINQAMVVTGILLGPLFFRVSRAAALSVARSQYVEAAQISGASLWWILRNHVWGKVLPPIAVSLAHTIGTGFVIVASLTFLGIGVQPPAPTWGGLLASDLGFLSYQPWAPVAPALLILIPVAASNVLADAVRDASGEAGRALVNNRLARSRRNRRDTRPVAAGSAS